MGLLSNKIQKEQLEPGDHIYTWRNGYSYSHHGIKTTNRSKPGSRSRQIRFLYAIFLALTLTPYPFLPSGFTRLALVVALYCGFIFELDTGVKKVATEKFGVTMEISSIEHQLPDVFTKALPAATLFPLLSKMAVLDIQSAS